VLCSSPTDISIWQKGNEVSIIASSFDRKNDTVICNPFLVFVKSLIHISSAFLAQVLPVPVGIP
jgi:hypothetical protein